jgi:hypothetical protein
MLLCLYRYYLPTLDSNDIGYSKGEIFEYQEEDQGQAEKGKPSTCYISESYHYTMHCSTLLLLLCIVFLILLFIPR